MSDAAVEDAKPRSALYSSKRKTELSKRESDVLFQMCTGAENKVIGARLELSEKTVKNHISRIFEKMHVPTRTAAVALALQVYFDPHQISVERSIS